VVRLFGVQFLDEWQGKTSRLVNKEPDIMADTFHKAKQSLNGLQHEYTATQSLTATSVFGVVHACDLALRALYETAVGSKFPHRQFKPSHQPEALSKKIGVNSFYSADCQLWLSGLTGRALSDARYPDSQAYSTYVGSGSANLAGYLLKGAASFIAETESLAQRSEVLAVVRRKA
jgi:hypothetical protein